MSFAEITTDLQSTLKSNLPQIRHLLKKSPALGYTRITELGRSVGKRYGMDLLVNFPKKGKIEEFEMYGKRDLSLIINMEKKTFPIDRAELKAKASELLAGSRTEDAYMYEGKEGIKVFLEEGRIDVLPHSLHVWCEFTPSVVRYCDWLLLRVYERG